MDQERPIEKLLRRAGEQRREQAGPPFALHPATRKLLQGEVARTFRRRDKAQRGWWRTLFTTPRWAWGVAFAAAIVLVGVAVLWSPGNHQTMLLSQNGQPTDAEVAAPSHEPVSQPALKPDSASRDLALADQLQTSKKDDFAQNESDARKDLGKTIVSSKAEAGEKLAVNLPSPATAASPAPTSRYGLRAGGAAPAPAPAVTQPESLAAKEQDRSLMRAQSAVSLAGARLNSASNELKTRTAQIAATPPAAFAAEPEAQGTYFADLGRQANTVVPAGSVARRFAERGVTSPMGSVLVSFRLEQTGNELKVIDQDGSVYRGAMEPTSANSILSLTSGATDEAVPAVAQAVAQSRPQADTAGGVGGAFPGLQTYQFKVAGTNASLKQKVVFTGNLLPITNGLTGFSNVAQAAAGRLEVNRTQNNQMLFLNARVVGQAVINDRQQIQINAVPEPPPPQGPR